MNRTRVALAATLAAILLGPASAASAQELILYSGRGESLVDPLVRAFEEQSGVTVNVRYGGTAELAILLQEEGEASPADVFWAQDPGALGAVSDLFAPLPEEILSQVPDAFHDENGKWTGASARARTLVYSTERVTEDELPDSILDLTGETYRGRVGWAPTNGSFQAHMTAMRVVLGDEATREWLEGMIANDVQAYANNTAQVQAVADGEIDFGLPNHYYLLRFKSTDPDFPVAQTHFEDGDIGNLVMVAGVGALASSNQPDLARQFVEFLLSPEAQQYFADEVHEYPVADQVSRNPMLESQEDLEAASIDVDLNDLDDLDGTLDMLRDVGLL